jgi:hypothetical protein
MLVVGVDLVSMLLVGLVSVLSIGLADMLLFGLAGMLLFGLAGMLLFGLAGQGRQRISGASITCICIMCTPPLASSP